jgi:taurine dioxygenase
MLELAPLSPTIGAEVRGVDLSGHFDAEATSALRDALLEWKVLFFRNQSLTPDQQLAFGRRFGELEVHPFAGHRDGYPELMVLDRDDTPPVEGQYRENVWHSDVTWRLCPSMGSILRAVQLPPIGGDTLWADMYAAYDDLSPSMQSSLEGLTAIHDFLPAFGPAIPPDQVAVMREQFPLAEHPVVATHPETGRKLLYVNASFTTRIVGMDLDESRSLLAFLTTRAARPEYQVRFRWEPGSVAFWDNRCTQHYAVQDYWPERRVMERATIVGEVPH